MLARRIAPRQTGHNIVATHGPAIRDARTDPDDYFGREGLSMSSTRNPDHHQIAGRIGGLVAHSRHDSRELTAAGRKAFLDRFEREVDPEGTLPESERKRRAELAKRAHMTRLAYASARARRRGQA